MNKKELFYAGKCSICNELKVEGQECPHCKLDDALKTCIDRIVKDNKTIGELKDKLKAQGKL